VGIYSVCGKKWLFNSTVPILPISGLCPCSIRWGCVWGLAYLRDCVWSARVPNPNPHPLVRRGGSERRRRWWAQEERSPRPRATTITASSSSCSASSQGAPAPPQPQMRCATPSRALPPAASASSCSCRRVTHAPSTLYVRHSRCPFLICLFSLLPRTGSLVLCCSGPNR
jgi:hypothetical protein